MGEVMLFSRAMITLRSSEEVLLLVVERQGECKGEPGMLDGRGWGLSRRLHYCWNWPWSLSAQHLSGLSEGPLAVDLDVDVRV